MAENAAQPGKQALGVRHKHHYLQGIGRVVTADGDFRHFHIVDNLRQMPQNLVFFVAHEIGGAERLPQAALLFGIVAGIGECIHCTHLALACDDGTVAFAAGKITVGGVEQAFQQAGFPRVPDFRIGTADIGHGQQIKRAQPLRGFHAFAEPFHHIGILNVFFLGGERHQKMVFHQPSQQFAVFFVHKMVGGKLAGIGDSLDGMVAAPAFGDVVKHRGQIQHIFGFERMHQAGGER